MFLTALTLGILGAGVGLAGVISGGSLTQASGGGQREREDQAQARDR